MRRFHNVRASARTWRARKVERGCTPADGPASGGVVRVGSVCARGGVVRVSEGRCCSRGVQALARPHHASRPGASERGFGSGRSKQGGRGAVERRRVDGVTEDAEGCASRCSCRARLPPEAHRGPWEGVTACSGHGISAKGGERWQRARSGGVWEWEVRKM
jgi:hypothetical protein